MADKVYCDYKKSRCRKLARLRITVGLPGGGRLTVKRCNEHAEPLRKGFTIVKEEKMSGR